MLWQNLICNSILAYNSGDKPGAISYAEKALQALAGYVDEQGRLEEICVGTGRGSTREYYIARPRAIGDAHGQAGLLWAASSIIDG